MALGAVSSRRRYLAEITRLYSMVNLGQTKSDLPTTMGLTLDC